MVLSLETLPEEDLTGSLLVDHNEISVDGLAAVLEFRAPESPEEKAIAVSSRSPLPERGFKVLEQEFNRHKLLSPTEVAVLTSAVQRGMQVQEYLGRIGPKRTARLSATRHDSLKADVSAGEIAKEKMINCNTKLVASIAVGLRGLGLSDLEMFSAGISGLTRAIEKFDWRLGYTFSTYATYWIRQSIQRAIADEASPIRIPVNVHERLWSIRSSRQRLIRNLGREPTEEEIGADTGLPLNAIREAVDAKTRNIRMASLNLQVGELEDVELIDFVPDSEAPDPESEIALESIRAQIRRSISSLPEQHRKVVELYFGFNDDPPMSLTAIADELDLPRNKVSDIKEQAISHLGSLQEIKDAASDLEMQTQENSSKAVEPIVWNLQNGESVKFTAGQTMVMPYYFSDMAHRVVAKRAGITFASAKHHRNELNKKLAALPQEEVAAQLQAMGIKSD